MICEHFRATGAYQAVQGLSDLFSIRLQDDDVQDYDTRCDQALIAASEIPTETVLEGSCIPTLSVIRLMKSCEDSPDDDPSYLCCKF